MIKLSSSLVLSLLIMLFMIGVCDNPNVVTTTTYYPIDYSVYSDATQAGWSMATYGTGGAKSSELSIFQFGTQSLKVRLWHTCCWYSALSLNHSGFDVSLYSYFSFWIKGSVGGETYAVIFYDGNYVYPTQTIYGRSEPYPSEAGADLTSDWQYVRIPIDRLLWDKDDGTDAQLNKTAIRAVEFAIGARAAVQSEQVFYIDNVGFEY